MIVMSIGFMGCTLMRMKCSGGCLMMKLRFIFIELELDYCKVIGNIHDNPDLLTK